MSIHYSQVKNGSKTNKNNSLFVIQTWAYSSTKLKMDQKENIAS